MFAALRDGVSKQQLGEAVDRFKASPQFTNKPEFLELAYAQAVLSLQPEAMSLLQESGARLDWNQPLTDATGRAVINWQEILAQLLFMLEPRCGVTMAFAMGRVGPAEINRLALENKDPFDPGNYSSTTVQRSKDGLTQRRAMQRQRVPVLELLLQHLGQDYGLRLDASTPLTPPGAPGSLAALAVRDSDDALLARLHARGEPLFTDADEGAALLTIASIQLHGEGVAFLLAAGADPDRSVPLRPGWARVLLSPPQFPGSPSPLSGMPDPTSAKAWIDWFRGADRGAVNYLLSMLVPVMLGSDRSFEDMTRLLRGDTTIALPSDDSGGAQASGLVQQACAATPAVDDERSRQARLKDCLFGAERDADFLLRRQLIDLSVVQPSSYISQVERASSTAVLPKMRFQMGGSYQVVDSGGIPAHTGTDFHDTVVLDKRYDRGEATWAKLIIKRAETVRKAGETWVTGGTRVYIEGRGGTNDRSAPRSDEPDTASVNYRFTGDLEVPGCSIDGTATAPCFSLVSFTNLGSFLTQGAQLTARQGARQVDLLTQPSAVFDRMDGPILFSMVQTGWFRMVGVHPTHTRETYLDFQIGLMRSFGAGRPNVNRIYDGLRALADVAENNTTLQDTWTSRLGLECAGAYLDGAAPKFSRRFQGLYLCLFAINKALVEYRDTLTSSEVRELQVASRYLSSLARVHFLDIVRTRASEFRDFVSQANLEPVNEALAAALEQRAAQADSLLALVSRLRAIGDLDPELRTAIDTFITDYLSAGNDQSDVLEAFKTRYLALVRQELLRQRLYLLELQQYEPPESAVEERRG